jgi:hypothetical protein
MAGPDRALPGDAEHGRLRASHADRDGVLDTLKSAYALGFVTKDELDARVTQTLTARTYAELAGVTTDLPAWLAAAQPPGRTPTRATLRPTERAIAAFALLAAVALAAAIVSDDGWLALGAIGSALASLFLMAAQTGTVRRPRQPGGQLPGPGPGPTDAGSGTAAAGSRPQSPRALQRGRQGDVRPPSRRRPRPLLSC